MKDIILTITPKQLEYTRLENEIQRLSKVKKFTKDKEALEEVSKEISSLKHQQELLK